MSSPWFGIINSEYFSMFQLIFLVSPFYHERLKFNLKKIIVMIYVTILVSLLNEQMQHIDILKRHFISIQILKRLIYTIF